MGLAAAEHPQPDRAGVLARAVTRAADHLGLSRAELGRILGLSPASMTRLYQGQHRLEPGSKSGELALLFVRIFRSLDAIVGTQEAARAWFEGHNLGLNGRPADLVRTPQGLVHVADYLDAHRARI